jgi:hypothetical protein
MEKMLIVMSVVCFIPNLFWLAAKVTGFGGFLGKMVVKTIALLGTLLPLIYWLKLLGVI